MTVLENLEPLLEKIVEKANKGHQKSIDAILAIADKYRAKLPTSVTTNNVAIITDGGKAVNDALNGIFRVATPPAPETIDVPIATIVDPDPTAN